MEDAVSSSRSEMDIKINSNNKKMSTLVDENEAHVNRIKKLTNVTKPCYYKILINLNFCKSIFKRTVKTMRI